MPAPSRAKAKAKVKGKGKGKDSKLSAQAGAAGSDLLAGEEFAGEGALPVPTSPLSPSKATQLIGNLHDLSIPELVHVVKSQAARGNATLALVASRQLRSRFAAMSSGEEEGGPKARAQAGAAGLDAEEPREQVFPTEAARAGAARYLDLSFYTALLELFARYGMMDHARAAIADMRGPGAPAALRPGVEELNLALMAASKNGAEDFVIELLEALYELGREEAGRAAAAAAAGGAAQSKSVPPADAAGDSRAKETAKEALASGILPEGFTAAWQPATLAAVVRYCVSCRNIEFALAVVADIHRRAALAADPAALDAAGANAPKGDVALESGEAEAGANSTADSAEEAEQHAEAEAEASESEAAQAGRHFIEQLPVVHTARWYRRDTRQGLLSLALNTAQPGIALDLALLIERSGVLPATSTDMWETLLRGAAEGYYVSISRDGSILHFSTARDTHILLDFVRERCPA